jgi:hypothetical protein
LQASEKLLDRCVVGIDGAEIDAIPVIEPRRQRFGNCDGD